MRQFAPPATSSATTGLSTAATRLASLMGASSSYGLIPCRIRPSPYGMEYDRPPNGAATTLLVYSVWSMSISPIRARRAGKGHADYVTNERPAWKT